MAAKTAPSPYFSFKESAGNDRKTSGSYYTPTSLVDCVLNSALNPVLNDRINKYATLGYPSAEAGILALKVCDPACGSGHFLIAAAQRIARQLAQIRAGDDEPSPDQLRRALREVISRCIYAVDINPMSVELCRVALWLEAVEPGKPLSFLDHHIRVGNSLLGATPELNAGGIPDEAFTAIDGDDKKACSALKKRNKAERTGLGPLFAEQDAETQAHLQRAAAELEALPDDRPEEIRAKELAFRDHEETEEYRHKKQLADAWCAAFVARKQFRDLSASGFTQTHLHGLASGQPLRTDIAAEVERLSGKYEFFHWHLAFPEVFARGGFDCVLGNPPWEKLKLMEVEFFAVRAPEISMATTQAQRHKLIEKLRNTRPDLFEEWQEATIRLSHPLIFHTTANV
jgi:N-6 DNA Methylase